MGNIILSASVGAEASVLRFQPGINILWGKNAEDVLFTLAGIFGGIPPEPFKAALNWRDDTILFVSGYDGSVFVGCAKSKANAPAQRTKEFHKQRFLRFCNTDHLLDGAQLPSGFAGASDRMVEMLRQAADQKDDRPLFICNLLERLDEAVDLQPILAALHATGRQVFIALPHCYTMKQPEEIPCAIHTL